MAYLTIKQTAERLGVHPNTVRNWINAGYIKALQPAPRCNIRIDEHQLTTHLAG